MKTLYKLALAEGEGLGTAYEYFVKLGLLKRLLKKEKIKDVLIYGLPEKYGFSFDFVYFCSKNNLNLFLYEKREGKKIRFKRIFNNLKNQKIIKNKAEITKKINRRYDLILSCEVLQSLNRDKLKEYVNNIEKYSKKAIVFVPNKSNKSHGKVSKLDGFSLKELKRLSNNVKKSGYIDAPPFPPGIKKNGKVENVFLIKILESFADLEKFMPPVIKKYLAHINYILIGNSRL